MVFVIAFACGDSVPGMRSFSCCTMSLDRSFLVCIAPFSMVVVRRSTCRCCGVRHANAQPSVSFATCPKLQFSFLVFKFALPGRCFSSVSGAVGCVIVRVKAREWGSDRVFLLDAHKPWCFMLLSASGRSSRSILHAEEQ